MNRNRHNFAGELSVVARAGSLPCRRLAVGKAMVRKLPTCGTGDCQSALQEILS